MVSKFESDGAKVIEEARKNLMASDRPGGVNRAAQLQAELAAVSQLAEGGLPDPERQAIAERAAAVAETTAETAAEPAPTIEQVFNAARKSLATQSHIPPVPEHPAIGEYRKRWSK